MDAFLSSLTVEHWLFYPMALLTIVGALGVLFARDPLHGALSLVVSFFFVAAIYVLLAAHFVGILQIIVYAGAIMVLFLFVIMLLALGERELGKKRVTVLKYVGGLFAVGFIAAALRYVGLRKGYSAPLIVDIGVDYKSLPADFGTVAAVGRVLFNDYILQFEAVSLLLLVAIAGAVVVAKGRI